MSLTRTRADLCPGVLRPFIASDGAIARVRLPGGEVTAEQLRVLAYCAAEFGAGAVTLTSRGALQVRGLDEDDMRLVERIDAAGLLPAPSHERSRNVIASPLSGIDGGVADIRGLPRTFDRELCARPELAALPGRFLIGFDDGRGDIAAEEPDLCWRALTPDLGVLLVAGLPTTVGSTPAEAAELLLDAADVFLTLRGSTGAWRARELPDAPTLVASVLRDRGWRAEAGAPGSATADFPAAPPVPPVGPVGRGALGVATVLGEISARQLRALTEVTDRAIVTPWRSFVLPEPAPSAAERLHAEGLITEPGDPRLLFSACTGLPGCARSHADVRSDVLAVLTLASLRTHVSGCERRCGTPHCPHLGLVAEPGGGYRVVSPVPVDRRVAEPLVLPDLRTALQNDPPQLDPA